MGMYDIVDFDMDCPFCGEDPGEWQTKSLSKSLATVEPESIPYNGRFYCSCENCDSWFEFKNNYEKPGVKEAIEKVESAGYRVVGGDR